MRKFNLIILLNFFVTLSFGQLEIDGKPLTEEQRKMVRETFTHEKFLSDYAKKSCSCIDSISIKNKNAKENAIEIKKCIDNEVIPYQQSLTIIEAANLKEGDSLTLKIYTNPESAIYIKHYREIERRLMDSCKTILDVVGRNNKELSKSISDDPAARKKYTDGSEYLRAKDYKNALPFYEAAVKIDPDFAFAWDNIGVCARNLGDFNKALKAYKKSLELAPEGITALQNLPMVYVSMGEYKKAIKAYGDLAKVDADNPEVFYGLGLIYYNNLKDSELALDNMCKAYNIYVDHKSPYRTDAEKVIQYLYQDFKEKNKEKDFDRILEANNISKN